MVPPRFVPLLLTTVVALSGCDAGGRGPGGAARAELASREDCNQLVQQTEVIFIARGLQGGAGDAITALGANEVLEHERQAIIEACQSHSKRYVDCAKERGHLDHDACDVHKAPGSAPLMARPRLGPADGWAILAALKQAAAAPPARRLAIWVGVCARTAACAGSCSRSFRHAADQGALEAPALARAAVQHAVEREGECAAFQQPGQPKQPGQPWQPQSDEVLRTRLEALVTSRLKHLLPDLRRQLEAEPQKQLAAALARGALTPGR